MVTVLHLHLHLHMQFIAAEQSTFSAWPDMTCLDLLPFLLVQTMAATDWNRQSPCYEMTTMALFPSDPSLSWHRNRIVEVQLTSLDKAISEWQQQNNDGIDSQPISCDYVQSALRISIIGVSVFQG